MKYTHIIWDFNGTLFNDVEAGIASVNKMLKERGLSEIPSVEYYRKIFKFPIIEYYRDLGFDFESEPYEVLAPIWVELYNLNSKASLLQAGAVEFLQYCRGRDIPQILLSATERNMLTEQIKDLGIDGYFDEIMGLDNIHAYSKQELAIRWKERCASADPLFIGDTEHDAAVARAIGADCVLVCNGHQGREHLESLGCNMFDDLHAVLEHFKSL